ncbi:hypothetical protein GY21_12550 [Cryobacterium roopkundense]|uniref:D-alanyl-D-alanine carboxypeptidase n=1 Tax=Cryobacterium roopkundense TaxID=1001240 RepID=A0A099J5Z7_9MICO|nr:serine hydrolase domain-containing protein [Cryobacterium roopkundense]KGJ72873.1 hypothetical protein GY21_12550 [Cryobacterium roopkundense]MBB5643130.1 D-alanyl-D-alanine carboxypeptidase [Cryobacterium roopkundense]
MKIPAGRRMNRVSVIRVAVLVSACLLLSGCTGDATAYGERDEALPGQITSQLEAAVNGAMAQADASGAIVGVWVPWAGRWVESPGTTTRGGSTPLTTDMRFRIGTNTTAMTCTVLLKLVDDGRVALDDEVSTYLPAIVGLSGVTLAQLCRNTSGLPDFTPLLTRQFVNTPTRQWPARELVANALGNPRVAAPGAVWAGSDTGIVLLGMALEAASGQSWNSLYHQYIFDPLGLSDTSYPDSEELTIPGAHPHGYAALGTCADVRDTTEITNSVAGVAGGVVSTLGDLKTWVQALVGAGLLSPESVEAQWTTVPAGDSAPSWQGYGVGVWRLGALRGSAGTIPGFLSAAFADPATGLTVVVMLNNSTAGVGFIRGLAQQLAAIASKAPRVEGGPAPTVGLPWSAEQAGAGLASAPCPAKAPAG